MTPRQQQLRRYQLDRQLLPIANAIPPSAPTGGWVRAIREALGMTLDSFGKRLGVAKQTASQLEHVESSGKLTISRLREAANALECDLVVLLVPRASLQQTVESAARRAAEKLVGRVSQTMSLESQDIPSDSEFEMVDATAREMIEQGDQRIWT